MALSLHILLVVCTRVLVAERRSFRDPGREHLLESVALVLKSAGTDGFNATADKMITEFDKIIADVQDQQAYMATFTDGIQVKWDNYQANLRKSLPGGRVLGPAFQNMSDQVKIVEEKVRNVVNFGDVASKDAAITGYLAYLHQISSYVNEMSEFCKEYDSLSDGKAEEENRKSEWNLASFSKCVLGRAKDATLTPQTQTKCQDGLDYAQQVGTLDWTKVDEIRKSKETFAHDCQLKQWSFAAGAWPTLSGTFYDASQKLREFKEFSEATPRVFGTLDEIKVTLQKSIDCNQARSTFVNQATWESTSGSSMPVWNSDDSVTQLCENGCTMTLQMSGQGTVNFKFLVASSNSNQDFSATVTLGEHTVQAGVDNVNTFNADFTDSQVLSIQATGGVLFLTDLTLQCSIIFEKQQ